MEYTRLGKTEAIVSRIGFGGAVVGLKNYIRDYDPNTDESKKQVYKALELALEKGITYFDTAPSYGDGISEVIFGEVLNGIDPQKIFIATKCHAFDPRQYMSGYNGSALSDYDYIMHSVEMSLKRLRRDYVDLLQLHGTSYSEEMKERILAPHGALEALEQLKKDGVIRFIGFTTEDNNKAVYDFINSNRFDTIQMCYNFIFQHPYEPSRPFGSMLEAEKKDMGIVVMRATTSGTFQKWIRKIRPDDTFDYTPALIQFVLSNKYVDVVLIGMRTPQHVLENVKLVDDMDGRISIEQLHERYV